MERKVRTGRLKKGMYVSSLDRAWLDTPFLIQGFYINDDEELRALDRYCEYVYIDTGRGIKADLYWDDSFILPTNVYLEKFLRNKVREVEYLDEHDTAEEIPLAQEVFEAVTEQFESIMLALKQGVKLDIKKIKALIQHLIDSILRNPDAMLWLSQLRDQQEQQYSQSVDHCILSIVFGRFMGLPKADIMNLATGALLLDIGKLNLPEEVLLKRTLLTDSEFKEVKRHVDDGFNILKNYAEIHEDSLNTVLTHHERYDGSGYPNKLSAMKIPVYGRIAGMIDCYQAMISKRPYSDAIGSHTALQKIYNWRNKSFQAELVEQFLRCLGVYPTGSLLEMKSGEVAIVLCQNKERHIKPKVMLLLDKNKEVFEDYPIVDLMFPEESGAEPFEILRGLDPGAFGIVPSDFHI